MEADLTAKYMDKMKIWDLEETTVLTVDPADRARRKATAAVHAMAKTRHPGEDEGMETADADVVDECKEEGHVLVPDTAYVLNDGTAMNPPWLAQQHKGCEAAIVKGVERAMTNDFKPGHADGGYAALSRRGEAEGTKALQEWHLTHSKNHAFMLSETQAGNPALVGTADSSSFQGILSKAKRQAHAKAACADKSEGRKGSGKLFSTTVVKKLLQDVKKELAELVGNRYHTTPPRMLHGTPLYCVAHLFNTPSLSPSSSCCPAVLYLVVSLALAVSLVC